ncbi:MAG: hypothetical protein RJA05_1993, partial [Planctomycetota bacterium]
VGDLSSYPLADTELDEGRDRLFPRGDLRFHLSADRVICGTVMVPCTEGNQTVMVARAYLWQPTGTDGSSWERVELDPETEPGAPAPCQRRSAVGGMNDDGVIVGARGWHAERPTDYTPTAWRRLTDGSMQMIRLGTQQQQEAWEEDHRSGMLCAVGGGAMPAVGGWVATACRSGEPSPIALSLDSAVQFPDEFTCELLAGSDPLLGRISAMEWDDDAGCVTPLGNLRGGGCVPSPSLSPCEAYPTNASYAVGFRCPDAVCFAVETPLIEPGGFDVRMIDAIDGMVAGWCRYYGQGELEECEQRATVVRDPFAMGDAPNAFNIHDTLPTDDSRPHSKLASIAGSGPNSLWSAVGARYGTPRDEGACECFLPTEDGALCAPRGVIWKSRMDGDTIEWCGDHMDSLVRGLPAGVVIHACTDVLPGGAAVGFGKVSECSTGPDGVMAPSPWGAPGGKLMLFTAAADLNGDLRVDGADLGRLSADWGMIAASDLSCSPDGAGGMVDGDDYGVLLSQWTGSGAVVSINWGCAGQWREGQILGAAAVAATMIGFDGLHAMASFATSAFPDDALGVTELGAVITQAILGGEP